ncbi:superoxide dismutase family protein [Rubrivirga sp. S365]|uniref:Superoxide dismutase [Cu-Zn] n=1 Tax=Rubrivirga litoralis TaxID=3075598 RepID=A0ABU3BRE0_9BACT|nr:MULTISPECIES: superoxide dismutase family protein [unclassified Rubrivirga]MDT0631860.1 superoxide dismutase family protein [Rubrivirga sp. F394]MDT7857913.1 superoxide dismutase family protein [Rubrivirga sp. S365]
MSRYTPLLVLLPALALAACDSDDDDIIDRVATAEISAPTDTTTGVTGTVAFRQTGDVLRMEVALAGLAPNSVHGFHLHTVGDCGRGDHDADGFAEVGGAAGGHYDPLDTNDHGAPTDDADDKHAGDFGNVTADAAGRVSAIVATDEVSLDGVRPVEGRSVVVHANRDDLETDPGGNSGGRIGCGVISDARDFL